MNRKIFIFGIIVILFATTFSFIFIRIFNADEKTLNGNWAGAANDEFRFSGNSWESRHEGGRKIKGYYKADNKNITMTITEIDYGAGWVSYPEESQTGTYAVKGSVLTLTFNSESRAFFRQGFIK